MKTSEQGLFVLPESAAVILAAGFSGRMGKPKLALPFDKHRTFVEKIVDVFRTSGVQKVVLVVNAEGKEWLKRKKIFPEEEKVTVVFNAFPERERFFSVKTGMQRVKEARAVFLHNIDNPFIPETLLPALAETFRPGGYSVPQYEGHGGHPVLFSREIVQDIVHYPGYDINLRDFLQSYPKLVYPVEDNRVLININSPEQYQRYFGKMPF
jgi:molybdenum cofactor cytidylyltransferase